MKPVRILIEERIGDTDVLLEPEEDGFLRIVAIKFPEK